MRDLRSSPNRRAFLTAGSALGVLAALAAPADLMPKVEAATDDPLIGLIATYRAGMLAYDTDENVGTGDADYDARREAETWGPAYAALTEAPPPAVTFAGAVAAVRLVVDEGAETCDLHIPLLEAALAYLERDEREAMR